MVAVRAAATCRGPLEMTFEADTDLYGSPVGRYVRTFR